MRCLQDGTFKYITVINVLILFNLVFAVPCFPTLIHFEGFFQEHRRNLTSFWKACLNSSLKAV